MNKKILVVGGAGYVGSVLVAELLEQGFAVRVFDRMFYGDQGLAPVRERVEAVAGDQRAVPPSVLDDIDAVINLGGLSNDPTAEYNPQANYEMNTVATLRLAEACKQRGIRRFCFASSCSIYDQGVSDAGRDVIQTEEDPVDPRAAYSRSKYEAERGLLALADQDFEPVILRKGTIYGFSPRMRYDLVVNTFVRDALSKGRIILHYGGEMWRPLVDIHDVARAYIACAEAPADKVAGQVFNVSYGNFRIAEVALRVREALRELDIPIELDTDYQYRAVRNYRCSTRRIETALGFRPLISIEESAKDMVLKIRQWGYTAFDDPRFYNIRWMRLLEEAAQIVGITGSVFGTPKTAAAGPAETPVRDGAGGLAPARREAGGRQPA